MFIFKRNQDLIPFCRIQLPLAYLQVNRMFIDSFSYIFVYQSMLIPSVISMTSYMLCK